jgi:hypothetical protein
MNCRWHALKVASQLHGARFFGRILHSRMPLDPTPARLKLLQACDQWHSSRRGSTVLPVDTVNYVQTLKAWSTFVELVRELSPSTSMCPGPDCDGHQGESSMGVYPTWYPCEPNTAPNTPPSTTNSTMSGARFPTRNLHSRMPLVPTHARLKRAC